MNGFGVIRAAAMLGVAAAGLVFMDALGIVALTLLTLACLSTTYLLSLRNVVVLYEFLVLGIGPYLLPQGNRAAIQTFACVLMACFLAGIGAAKLSQAARVRRDARPVKTEPAGSSAPRRAEPAEPARRAGGRRAARVPLLLLVPVLAQAGLIALDLAKYGLAGLLSGSSLTGKITDFALGRGLDGRGMLTLLVSIATIGCLAAYAAAAEPDRQYPWPWLIAVLIVLPGLRLDRSAVITGVLGLLFFTTRQRPTATSRRLGRTPVIVVTVAVAVLAAFGIGILRSTALTANPDRSTAAVSLVIGEASPVRVVAGAIAPGAPRYGGTPVYEPMALRFVPRRFYPGKAENTTTRYMLEHDPHAFAAGYTQAPSLLGVVILNYGQAAACLVALLAGMLLTSRRDLELLASGTLVVLYLNINSLLRNDPSNSIPTTVAALAVCAAIGAVRRIRSAHRLRTSLEPRDRTVTSARVGAR